MRSLVRTYQKGQTCGPARLAAGERKRAEILQYLQASHYGATLREICAAVGLRSISTVSSHLEILQANGLATRRKPGSPRIFAADPNREPDLVPMGPIL